MVYFDRVLHARPIFGSQQEEVKESHEEYEDYDGLCWECWDDQLTE
ncbi:MAG: hypothetical protein IAX22_03735 [Candidatus Bathyarchaeota archaeon]|nr:hypothetical protein [Thermoproteota archaeon]MDT8781743.1 hypothetical protein [Candidatus Bathyarchaeota archaeon]NLD67055.1 hypothetical protein [Thermoproteota archaeon]